MPHEYTCEAWPNVWKRRGIRAPHKPLLLLVALREALDDSDRLMPFRWWDEKLRPLLRKYTTSKSLHTEYPFWRLQRDGLWEVLGGEGLIKRRSNDDPLNSELIANNVRGGLTESMFRTLKADQTFRSDFIGAMLRHFPELVHEELLRDVGLGSLQESGNRRSTTCH